MGGDAPTWPLKQAPSRTLLGMLQRGTGRGYREALRRPDDGRAALWQCVTHDPRWDRPIEARGDYYGRLAVQLGIPPTEVLAWLRAHDDVDETSGGRGWLMRDVAEWQLKAGVPGAGTTFLWIIEFGYGWEDVLYSVDALESAVPWPRLAAALRRRFPGREALRAAFDGISHHVAARLAQFDPWFDVQPAEERAEARPRSMRYSSQELQAASLEQLLEYGDDFNTAKLAAEEIRRRNIPIADLEPVLFQPRPRGPFVEEDGRRVRTGGGKTYPPSVLVMRSMVGRDEPAVFDAAVKVITGYRGRRHGRFQLKRFAREALAALPAGQVVPLARAWRDSRTWDMALTGIEILHRHATAEDIPWLLRRIAPPRPRPDHHPCSLLEVLEHLVAFGPWPEVAKVYRTTQLSCTRERAVRIMAQADPDFATTAAVDCLWDCESETRRIACERVDLDAPGARERVEALAADPWESEQVREAARSRLT